jgi:hypothetical protein
MNQDKENNRMEVDIRLSAQVEYCSSVLQACAWRPVDLKDDTYQVQFQKMVQNLWNIVQESGDKMTVWYIHTMVV